PSRAPAAPRRARVASGRADDEGTPAYNYDLSLDRARAVVEALVARGIEGERLIPSGNGEGRAVLEVGEAVAVTTTDEPLREVRFSILVWDEARAAFP
ncbi:MAG: OmpA family protein, partial [Myxococcota bacterium]